NAAGPMRPGQDRAGVGPDREKAGDTDVEQSGAAELQIEAERGHREDRDECAREDQVGDQIDAHDDRPKIPRGRISKIKMITMNEIACRHSAMPACTAAASARPRIMAPASVP